MTETTAAFYNGRRPASWLAAIIIGTMAFLPARDKNTLAGQINIKRANVRLNSGWHSVLVSTLAMINEVN